MGSFFKRHTPPTWYIDATLTTYALPLNHQGIPRGPRTYTDCFANNRPLSQKHCILCIVIYWYKASVYKVKSNSEYIFRNLTEFIRAARSVNASSFFKVPCVTKTKVQTPTDRTRLAPLLNKTKNVHVAAYGKDLESK